MKKWLNYSFTSSTTATPEFKSFCKDFKKHLKNLLKPELELVSFSKGHFDFYGFIKNIKTGNIAYFSSSDVRFFPDRWYNNLLIRTAKNIKDFTGGSNNFTSLDNLKSNLLNLTEEKEQKTCPYCFEMIENCVCVWTKCSECGARIPESEASEYRGRVWCEKHNFDEQVAKRDRERQQVMEITKASVLSQRKGEFINKRNKYHINNVASDGLPIIKVEEPEVLKKYERNK